MGNTKHKILIVDDTEINRMLLREILSDEYDVVEADSGEMALRLMWDMGTQLSCIILDILMPGMSGIDVLEKMKERDLLLGTVPVIVISSDREDDTLIRVFELGVTDYIQRPFNALLVKKRVHNTIQLFQKLDQNVRKVKELEYESSKAQFYTSITNDVLFEYSAHEDILTVSEQGQQEFELPGMIECPMENRMFARVVSKHDLIDFVDRVKKLESETDRARTEMQLSGKDGVQWYRIVAKRLLAKDRKSFDGMIGVATNVNIEHERIETLKERASTDSLTGLLNKGTMENSIKHCLSQIRDEKYALMILDVDNLKMINDTDGHIVGDQTLRLASKQIQKSTRKSDLLGRIGGDEFMIFFQCGENPHQVANAIFNRIMQTNAEDHLSLSAGYTVVKGRNASFQELYEEADTALYQAKRNGKKQLAVYGGTDGTTVSKL